MSKVKSIFLTLAVCTAIAFICLFGYIMLQNLCAELFILWGLETRTVTNLFANGFVWAFFSAAIFAPLIEELIFRFLICKVLQLTKMKFWMIVVIAAVIFALYHRSWSQLIYQFIMGIFLAWIFLKTNNLLWTILIHFLNNAFIVTYTYIAGAGSGVFALSAGNICLAVVTAAVATVAVIFLIKKGIPYAKKQ